MKRNIISSKVEPQNTEDLWLNLVDGNIYSYEYGTWTNVNNVPNRVFNHTKTQAYYDLLRKFGYEIIEPEP